MAGEDDLLACLLDVAEAELKSLNGNVNLDSQNNFKADQVETPVPSIKKKSLVEVNLFCDKDESGASVGTNHNKGIGNSSSIHNGDTDSSDDEGNRNYENKKYNDYGRDIKSMFDHTTSSGLLNSAKLGNLKSKSNNNIKKPLTQLAVKPKSQAAKPFTSVYTDPVFGISIVNPLVSSTFLEERVAGRKPVPIHQINKHLKTLKKDEDWIVAGVICNKGVTKTSAKGNQFIIWTISDLLGDIKTVAVFLFGSAYKEFWKTQPGSVIGILNPSILEKREGSRDEAALSVDNAQKILILGQSKDLGTCRSIKKNGDKCTAIVNKGKCEFCVYHIKQEYQKCSQRSDLQASYSGKGLIALRNKVLGKNEVFYAGKSYMAIPAKQSKKLLKKDQNRLQSLSGTAAPDIVKRKQKTVNPKAASSFDVCRNQRLKDIETLKKLGVNTQKYTNGNSTQDLSHSKQVSLQNSKDEAAKILSKLKDKPKGLDSGDGNRVNNKNQLDSLQLQKSLNDIVENDLADFDLVPKSNTSSNSVAETENTELENKEINSGKLDSVKKNQERLKISENVPENEKELNINENIKTPVFSKTLMMSTTPTLSSNGNFIDLNKPLLHNRSNRAKLNALKIIQKTGPLKKIDPNNTRGSGVKRKFDETLSNTENGTKLKKIQENEFLSDRFKKMMEIQSRHTDLIEMRDDEEKEKYFKKLEAKERMEEKMANTYKIECKAVRCTVCKYTSFSAAEKCKIEKHRLRVFDAVKRFFKCGNCGNRVTCLDIIPLNPCNNCNCIQWERTTMMKEKNFTNTVALSIRGGEQQFTNSVVTDANINLLVPDDI